ncbi:MFS transporter [Kitasatospora sp. NPDC056184]|uniref:MFS transporter n=1 Tax=Kitasatospora sp. NPDC056184 TaxID=3345738 RepID=UPI0035E384FD
MTVSPQVAAGPRPPSEHPAQRRVLAVLVASQLVSGVGLTAGVVVGSLIAEEMLGSTGLAGLPTALFTGGSMLGALGLGRLCQSWGRRAGLGLGYAVGALGSVGVVVAVAADRVALLLPALVVYGAGTATNLLARYAGADLAAPERRGRAVSRVLLAATFGAVAGPNLVALVGGAAEARGIPGTAAPFVLAAVGYAVAAVVLGTLLRPDPLREARSWAPPPAPAVARAAAAEPADRAAAAEPADRAARDPVRTPGVATGLWIMVLGQLPKVALMTMTPVHLAANGHGTGAIGLVVSLHIAAMFLPSPLSGLLVDRWGALPVAAASGVTLAAAALLAGLAPADSVPVLAAALLLAGVGWNLGLVGGTAVVTAAAPPARGAAVQGLADVGLSVAGCTGGLLSGPVVAAGGYGTLAVGCALVALLVAPLAAWAARPPRAAAGGGPLPPPGAPRR